MENISKDAPKSIDTRESVRGKLQYYQEIINHIEKQKKEKEESELEIKS